MLREALATPFRGSEAAATVVVGSALIVASVVSVGLWTGAAALDPRAAVLFPLALVPYLLLRGYGVRVVASGLRHDPAAPTFSRPGVLLRDGIKSTVLSLLLLLPLWVTVAIGSVAIGAVRLDRLDVAGVGPELSTATAGFVGIVGGGWLVCYAYLRPAAQASFANQHRLRDGLHPGTVVRVALDGEYLKGWVLGTLVLGTGLLVALPFVTLVVGIPLAFVATIAMNWLYGRGAASLLRPDRPPATGVAVEQTAEPTPEPESVTAPTSKSDTSATSVEEADELPPGGVEFPSVVEADPSVQVGRRVPLTATDILSKSVGSSNEETDAESPSESASSEGESETDDTATENETSTENGTATENETSTENGTATENETSTENGTATENETSTENGAATENETSTENETLAENGTATENDATNRAASVDGNGNLVDKRRDPDAERHRNEPDETGFMWGAKSNEDADN